MGAMRRRTDDLTLLMPRDDISNRLVMAPETVSRAFECLRDTD